jgi:hypothetical protein
VIMNDRTKTGLQILQVAVGIGILGDILLRVTQWGVNVLLFNLAFAAGALFLLKRHAPERLTAQTLSLFGALIFFASMFVWRDSMELRLADSVAILAILSALFLPKFNITHRVAGVVHYIAAFLFSSFNAVFAPFALAGSDIEWKIIPKSGWRRHAFSVARGVAIAAPLVLIFGGLFMAADAAYEGLVQRVFNFDPTIIFTHFALFAVFAWLSAGYLRGVLLHGAGVIPDAIFQAAAQTAASGEADVTEARKGSRMDRVSAEPGEDPVTLPDDHTVVEHINISDPPNAAPEAETRPVGSVPDADLKGDKGTKWSWPHIDNSMLPGAFTLGTVEIGVILGLMNLLFLSFVIVQVPYLFGGMEFIQNTPDFKLAEYARRGFGELVAVSALVLPVLLAAHWLIKKDSPFAQKLFRVLAGTQIVLLFVIMASAVQRLVLLTGNLGYGMTTVRLYPLIFMTWLAVVFVWFGATVLRGTRQYFAWGALWSAFVILGATHVLNPDAFIVKTNVALMREGREFDAYYNSAELSDDSLPALVEAFPELNYDQQITVMKRVRERYCRSFGEADLRSWNVSRHQTATMLHSMGALVDEYGHCEEVWLSDGYPHD